MGTLADFLTQRRESPALAPEGEALPDSQDSQDSQQHADAQALRARLIAEARGEGIDPGLIHRAPDADLEGCDSLDSEGVRAFLRALEATEAMDMGLRPIAYSVAAVCDHCGPVFLAANQPARVKACPWCFRHKAGKAIPRPDVRCSGCAHRIPDTVNPEGGMGRCGVDAARAFWPEQQHPCGDHKGPAA